MIGMPCVLVVFKAEFNPFEHVEWSPEIDVECIIKSSYDDYGRVAAVDNYTTGQIDLLIKRRYHSFIHQRAWDWAVERFPSPSHDETDIFRRTPQPWQKEMKSVLTAFLYACRNPLAGYWATGQYYTEAIPEIVAHMKLVENCLVDIIMTNPYMGGDEDNYAVDEQTARKLLAKCKKKKLDKRAASW